MSVDGRAIDDDAWRLRRARTLVKVLALAPRRRMHREQIVDALWPDLEPAAAANSLHQTLHVARRTLALSGASVLPLRDDVLHLCPGLPLWIDVEAFDAALAEARRGQDPAAYQAAADLYSGDLLPEDPYEDWAAGRRAMLRQAYLDLLLDLARLHEARREHGAAIVTLRRLLAVEQAHEEAHAGLMRLYAATGRRRQALRQYALLREAMRDELDAEPQEASQTLYRGILAGHVAPDLAPEDRAPRRGPDPPPAKRDNLPVQISSFVGRVHDLAEVRGLLARARLVTLTGTGGCGKTRLAIQLATELRERFPDGAWLVELASIGQPALAPQAVAVALGVPEQQGRPLVETLTAYLESKELLLVLDNCEHLIAACAALAETLARACPRLCVLSTSREPLRVAGEVIWRVSSLNLPDPRQLPALDTLRAFDAVRLFIDRAQAIVPSFAATEQTAPAIAQICYRLDGLPLAIEMAAARLTTLSVEHIAARLDDCFRLLTGGSRTALSRQQTLKSTLDWSYDLLPVPERVLFARLAVFAGGFTLNAVEAVCAGDGIGASEVLDRVTALIDTSLIVMEAGAGEVRYRLLEPIRQYARRRLEEARELAAVRERHRDWCLDLAEQARDELWTTRHAAALARLEGEHDNLRAALDWCLEEGAAAPGARLVGALWQFWLSRGYLAEGRRWLERMLARVPERSAPRAAMLLYDHALISRMGAPATAIRAAVAECRSIYHELGDTRGTAHAAYCMGIKTWIDGMDGEAMALFTESLTLTRAAGFIAGEALALHALGMLAWSVRDYSRAVTLVEESLALLPWEQDGRAIAAAFPNLGRFEIPSRDGGPPTVQLEEPLLLLREISTATARGYMLANLGNLARVQGDFARAQSRLEEGAARFQVIGDQSALAQVLVQLGNLAREAEDYERAGALLAESMAIRRAMGERLGIARTLNHQGSLAMARGDREGAAAFHEESLAIFRAHGDRPGMAGTFEMMGHLARSRNDYLEARALYEQSHAIFDEMQPHAPFLGFSLLNQGGAAYVQGDQAARAHFDACLTALRKMDDRRHAAFWTRLLDELAGETAGIRPTRFD